MFHHHLPQGNTNVPSSPHLHWLDQSGSCPESRIGLQRNHGRMGHCQGIRWEFRRSRRPLVRITLQSIPESAGSHAFGHAAFLQSNLARIGGAKFPGKWRIVCTCCLKSDTLFPDYRRGCTAMWSSSASHARNVEIICWTLTHRRGVICARWNRFMRNANKLSTALSISIQ